MKLKRNLLLASMALLSLTSISSHAGRQGVNFYYGLGIGAILPANSDVTAAGNILFGIEEDGWAFEAIGYASIETGTDDPDVDYSVSGAQYGLAYRTIERNKQWYKFKVSRTDMAFDLKGNLSPAPNDFDTDGTSYTIGWGMRMDHDARFEVDYDYYDSSDPDGAAHFITARYFWGGA